jgi:tetratricopeptide (TPR) repeat protein
MKKSFFLGFLMSLSLGVFAQLSIPEPSPSASFSQTLGFTKIKVDYARPSAKGREVFGKLIPYGEMWRTGASDCSTISFNEELTIGGKKIAKGKYSLFSIPNADQWTIIINTDTTLHGTSGYDEKKDVHRFTVKPEKSSRFYETFTIELSDIVKDNGILYLIWENTMAKIEIQTTAKERILADIDNKINKLKTDNSKLYYQAAEYYYNQRMELDQANTWIAKAVKMEADNFYYPNLQAKILETQGKFAEAIPVAQKAIELAKKGNMTQTATNWEKKVAIWQQTTGVKAQATDEHAGHDMKDMKTENVSQKPKLDADVQASLNKILTNYYGVKNALIADDGKTANTQAVEFIKMLATVPMAKMTADQHTLFMGLSEKVKFDAQHISETKDVKHQREHFNDLSNNFFAMMKGLNANQQPVYQQYCPMAKAYWMSDNAAVKNPYYGKAMLTCGKVTETLK